MPDITIATEGFQTLLQQGVEGVVPLVDTFLRAGVEHAASDILLEPDADGVGIRMRIDGVLQPFARLPASLAANVTARCKVLAGLLSYRTDLPQEGGAPGEQIKPGVEFRISTFPTVRGERVAIRIFDPDRRRTTLEQLGLSDKNVQSLQQALAHNDGLLLLAGPSGSGKTSTLYAALRYVREQAHGGRSLVSLEDPVENEIAGVAQVQIHPASGLTFAASLRSLLRQDPEVIMVGEIRDAETAGIVLESSLTGHLVLSTVHAGRVATVPHRLLDMGVEPYALAGSLRLVLAQRLLRKLCSQCKRPAETESANEIGFEAVGCDACCQTGYVGRFLLAEELLPSQALHDAILEKAPRHRFEAIANQAGDDLPTQARAAVAQGLTTLDEVKRVLR